MNAVLRQRIRALDQRVNIARFGIGWQNAKRLRELDESLGEKEVLSIVQAESNPRQRDLSGGANARGIGERYGVGARPQLELVGCERLAGVIESKPRRNVGQDGHVLRYDIADQDVRSNAVGL